MELSSNKPMVLANATDDEEIGEEEQAVGLPTEVIYYEVLSRIPVETLLPLCRGVCKDWKRLLGEWRFRQANYQRTKVLCGFFVQSFCYCHTRSNRVIDFVSKVDHSPPLTSPTFDKLRNKTRRFSILGSSSNNSSGILCCYAPYPARYFIYKPTTNDMVFLPHPMTQFKTVAVELMVVKYIKHHIHYKVFRVSRLEVGSWNSEHYCEIFDSTRSWKWKRTSNRSLPRQFFPCEQGVLINAAFHWVSKFTTISYGIIAFNMKDERWQSDIKVPQQINDSFECYHFCKLVDYNGKLGLIHHAISDRNLCMSLKIWVMEDYVEKKWSVVRSYLESVHSPLWASPVMQIHGDWLLAMWLDGRMVWIDYDQRYISCARHKIICQEAKRVVRAFPFESDLSPVDLHSK
ncbi:hypothetical protein Sjap_001561 [Stephania japonica]|uniref:F-box associated beta-propeller type 3 domain-containing protein n=1 Tax=Stephania japonica TaxID=461633 RepID=A0AAP0KKB9_9MAGN